MTSYGVLQFPGSCDERDALGACELAGDARLIWHQDDDLSGLDAIVIPGGFSYGDYLRAGAIARFAPAMEAVARFAAGGGPVLGICNGFQVLCEAGLLPGALLDNEGRKFVFRQARLRAEDTAGNWMAGIDTGEELSIPIKHASGRFYAPDEMLERIESSGQVVLRYGEGENPNGSVNDIAGVRNEAGNVMGLMPHPEHAVDELTGSTDGLRIIGAVALAPVRATG